MPIYNSALSADYIFSSDTYDDGVRGHSMETVEKHLRELKVVSKVVPMPIRAFQGENPLMDMILEIEYRPGEDGPDGMSDAKLIKPLLPGSGGSEVDTGGYYDQEDVIEKIAA